MAEIVTTLTGAGAGFFIENSAAGQGSGSVQITTIRAPSPLVVRTPFLPNEPAGIFVVSGDDGGKMTNNQPYSGTITIGDLDAWSFSACLGSPLNLYLNKTGGDADFVPSVRLYSPTGALSGTATGSNVALSLSAPTSGFYTVVIGDGSAGGAAAGTYVLEGSGISDSLTICAPQLYGTNMVVQCTGGVASNDCVILTSIDPTLSMLSWTSMISGKLSSLGDYTVTNTVDPASPCRYFRARYP